MLSIKIGITGILMMQIFLYAGVDYNYENGGKLISKLSERAIKALPPNYSISL